MNPMDPTNNCSRWSRLGGIHPQPNIINPTPALNLPSRCRCITTSRCKGQPSSPSICWKVGSSCSAAEALPSIS
jgi:hypothetical protein